MSAINQLSSDNIEEIKKLTKEEIEKIFEKYTKYFSEFLRGKYPPDDKEKSERDGKDYN